MVEPDVQHQQYPGSPGVEHPPRRVLRDKYHPPLAQRRQVHQVVRCHVVQSRGAPTALGPDDDRTYASTME
jgi:hypothetical protein